MHLRIPLLLRIFCGAGCADQRGIYDSAAPHHPPRLFQAAVDGVKKQFANAFFLQQVPEVQQCCGVRDILLKKVDPHESAHSIAVINGVFYPLVGQVEPALQQIHPQHGFDLNGWTAPFPGGVVRYDQRYPFLPRDNLIHDLLKLFPFCFLFPATVFHIAEAFLFHVLPPSFSYYITSSFILWD